MKDKKLLQKIQLLAEKYSATGQDIYSYLDGLLYADYMGYWNYIKLETLLSIQTPQTDFPDEKIFIIYHQITELYFKLCLIEIEHINKNGRNVLETGEDLGWNKTLTTDIFIEKMTRLNRYLNKMIDSFDIMIEGMDKKEFLKFRMALLPSSGFQSVQFRMLEIRSTDLTNLSKKSSKNSNLREIYEHLYWKSGANELATGEKTYTLKQFEKKYNERLIKLCNKMTTKNIWAKYKELSSKDQQNKSLIKLMREFDLNVNIHWKLAHYKSAIKYLKSKNKIIAATGGTNWQSYLPPRFQKVIFFPDLWSEKEKKEWGKSWIESNIK
ncbi:MAG: tryptophan 2,3-dioxygenase [Flavobacteriales bacterium]|jgi:tryptophan 2,3-dioxygenase|nr:tryptophan 2,3-dioxygenase [Flavobacteriales bacterium]|tara:strand:- start:1009 stop:1983 length:975 start_codon:yes stop_codon:yes gene_type:complete